MNSNAQASRALAEVALGETPPDKVITNGILFNAFTGEFIPDQSIWIQGERIAYVGPEQAERCEKTQVIDAEGMVLLPGLIEGHTHVVNRAGIEEIVKHTIPGGTTTIIAETIELATVVGLEGMKHLIEGLADQPIRFFFTAAPLCGLTTAQEANAPALEDYLDLLADRKCLGIGEVYWGNILPKTDQGGRVAELTAAALELGKRVEGHSAGAAGKKLQAYTCYGASSCHEPVTEDQVLERLRLGYWVMIREGAIRKDLNTIGGIFSRAIDQRRLILSTDGQDPAGFLREGFLDATLRKALAMGVPTAQAYQMVTLNVAEHFRLDHEIGCIAPGRMADVVISPTPEEYDPRLVMCGGRILYRDGQPLAEPRRPSFPEHFFNTVESSRYEPSPIPQTGRVRIMELVTRLVTRERIVDLEDPEESRDLLLALAWDRLGGEKGFTGMLKGYGLEIGACGTTMCWDSFDLIAVGKDHQSLATAVHRLEELGGGAVFAIGDEIIAEIASPLCGVISMLPMEKLAAAIGDLEARLRSNGVKWYKPLLTLDTLTTAAIPHLRITHDGYVRLRDRALLPLVV